MWSVLKYFIRLLRPQSQKLLQHLINIFPFLLEKDFFKNWFTKRQFKDEMQRLEIFA
jgi:hypothetical protein